MADTFVVQITNNRTGEEQHGATAHSESHALRLAEREAERLVETLDRTREVSEHGARFEPDHSAGECYRWLVWEPIAELSEEVAFTVTVLMGDEETTGCP